MLLTAMNIDGTADTTGTATLAAVAGTSDDAVVTGQVKFSSTGAFVATGGTGSADDGAGFVVAAGVGSSLGQVAAVDVGTVTGAASAIDVIDAAIEKVTSARGDLGAISNRLDNTMSNLTNISTNVTSSQSRIQDADFAAESTNLAKAQILQQAATAMLAQANASKQGVLSLLQG
jgi:flagellin